MKINRLKRTTAFALVLSILLTISAWASVLGEEVDKAQTNLGTGMELAKGVYWTGSDYRTENYIEYTPNSTVVPVVTYGSKILNYGKFSSMANVMEKQGYHVIAGINGDYFNTSDYQPLGIVVTDGVLRSSDDGHWAVGFREDGTAIIGKPAINASLVIGSETYSVPFINKTRTGNHYALYTYDYSATTRNTAPGHDIIVSVVSGEQLTLNSELTLEVEEILDSEGPVNIPEGQMVISLADTADSWRQYGVENVQVGDQLTLKITCDEAWSDVRFAVGSLYKLVTGGKIESGLDNTLAPRTAVGLKADGTMVLYTVDGRQSDLSVGATMTQVATRLIELGCVEATIMDGGGSTSLNAIYIGDSSISQINSPSGGYQRPVTNYIMLATKELPTGVATQLGISPYSVSMLSGAKTSFTAKAADEFGYAAATPGQVNYAVTEGLGTIKADGSFVASGAGVGAVSATANGLTPAEAALTVISTPDEIKVKNEATGQSVTSLKLYVDKSVDLSASALYKHIKLLSSDDCYTWAVEGNIGTIDSTGKFTAGNKVGTGVIKVSAGEKVISIAVEVIYPPGRFEDVAENSWYFDYVSFAAIEGLFKGVSETRFGPDESMSRSMFATVLYRLAGSPTVSSQTTNFTDIPTGEWYSDAVAWAAQNGIVTGYDDGTFKPKDNVTREQMAAIMYRYAVWAKRVNGTSADLSGFVDGDKISSYAKEAMAWAVGTKLINGIDRDSSLLLAPSESATRAQVAAIMQRFKQSLS